MPEFHSLSGYASVTADALELPRARALVAAVERHPDTRLIEILQSKADLHNEALIISLGCDAVPTRNAAGIRSPERLAIVVTAGEVGPPTVLALRKDFPEVMHENWVPPGEPRSLCLYFESARPVMRTWTPEKFLARIQWWMRGTATGTIHAADQPVEQPFFETGYELVLPSNFDEVRANKSSSLHVVAIEPRHRDGAHTLRLVAEQQGHLDKKLDVVFVDFPEPLLHGTRTALSGKLGDLADALTARGINLTEILRQQFTSAMEPKGERLAGAADRVVLILSIPIVRVQGGAVERTQRLAFLVTKGRLELGLLLGAYCLNDGVVFTQTLLGGHQPEEKDWRDIQTLPAKVLSMPDAKALRQYSGIQEEGPSAGVLVGTGALGSELLDLWVRAGWGRWAAVDSDHVKPHNLARHHALGFHTGKPKAQVVAELVNLVSDQAAVTQAVVADVCGSQDAELAALLDGADLIVDCSTTLDFPRQTSRSERVGRHASLFLTPSGNASVLLVEDKGRAIRLLTLEAQYYRAILNNEWGRSHLKGHQGTFWSGASCRDISYKLAHSSVVVHAGNLAEQTRRLAAEDQASIRVWERNPDTGAVVPHVIPTMPLVRWQHGDLTVYADEGLLQKLRALRRDELPSETGGVLLGYHDLNLGEAVIVDVLPAPADSKRSAGHFERGVEGLREHVKVAQERTAHVVGYLGEWHSHPRGHSARPSQDDILQVLNLAEKMSEEGLPFIQLIVGEKDIEVFVGKAI